MKNSKNRQFQQVPGGEYDNYGFYYTPDGSFWDPDGVYFNSEGYDCHGGYYNEVLEYCPGPGWIEELMCYEDEKKDVLKKMRIGGKTNQDNMPCLFEEDLEDEGDVDDIYEEIDYNKMMEDEVKKFGDLEVDEEDNQPETRKVYHPKNSVNNTTINQYRNNIINRFKEEEVECEKKEEVIITPDMLFNKIPENLKPKNIKENLNENKNDNQNQNQNTQNMKKIETKIEIDSLFG